MPIRSTWMEAAGSDDECRDLLRRDRQTIEYFVPAWTNSYWEPVPELHAEVADWV